MSENNSITVSVGAKRQAGDYEPVEVRVSYTLLLEPNATLEEFRATEEVLYGEIVGQLEAQITDAVRRLQASKLDGTAVAQEAERRPRQPEGFPSPVTPPTNRAPVPPTAPVAAPERTQTFDGSIVWARAKFWPKKDDRKIGQFWAGRVLDFEKGKFTGPSGKEYQALVVTVEDGKYPKSVKIFHDAPAYPKEGSAWRDFFVEGGKYNCKDKNVYLILGHTGKMYRDALEAVPLEFTVNPDAMPNFPSWTEGGNPDNATETPGNWPF